MIRCYGAIPPRPRRRKPPPISINIVRKDAPAGTPFARSGNLRADREVILHLDYPRRRPGGALSFPPFGPRTNGASEDHLAAIRFYGNAAGVDLRAAPECLLDLAFDLARRDVRL